MPRERHGVGDATGARSGPLAKIAVYYTAHLARRANRSSKGRQMVIAPNVTRLGPRPCSARWNATCPLSRIPLELYQFLVYAGSWR